MWLYVILQIKQNLKTNQLIIRSSISITWITICLISISWLRKKIYLTSFSRCSYFLKLIVIHEQSCEQAPSLQKFQHRKRRLALEITVGKNTLYYFYLFSPFHIITYIDKDSVSAAWCYTNAISSRTRLNDTMPRPQGWI